MTDSTVNICIVGVGNIAIHHINGIIRNKNKKIKLFLVDKDNKKMLLLESLIKDYVHDLIILDAIDPSVSYDCIINCLPYYIRQNQSSWDGINNSKSKMLIVEKPLGLTDLKNIKLSKTVSPYIRAIDFYRSSCANDILYNKFKLPSEIVITEYSSVEPTTGLLIDLHSHLLSIAILILNKTACIDGIEDIIISENKQIKYLLKSGSMVCQIVINFEFSNSNSITNINIDGKEYNYPTLTEILPVSKLVFLKEYFIYRRKLHIYDNFKIFYNKLINESWLVPQEFRWMKVCLLCDSEITNKIIEAIDNE